MHAGKTLFPIDDTWTPRINRTDRTGLNIDSAARTSSPRTRTDFHEETSSVRTLSGNNRQRQIIARKLGANFLRKKNANSPKLISSALPQANCPTNECSDALDGNCRNTSVVAGRGNHSPHRQRQAQQS